MSKVTSKVNLQKGTKEVDITTVGSVDTLNVILRDSAGNQISSFGGSGGTSHADDAAFTIGSASSLTPTGYLANETSPDSVDEGDVGVPRMTLTRKPYAVLSNPTGEINATVLDYTNSNPLAVRLTDTNGDYVGAGAGTEYTEDAVSPADPIGKAIMVTRDDALSTVTEAEGDWSRLRGTAEGALWVQDFNSDAILTNTGTIAGDTTSIDSKITACNTGAVVLAAGTASIGKLAANDGVDIGDVTINNASIAVTGTFWQDTQPVSIAGTVTVDLGANNDVTLNAGSNKVGDVGLLGNTAADGSGTDYHALIDTSGHLQVDVVSGGGAGEQYADGTAVNAAYKGNLVLGTDGSNYQILATDASGNLQVDILNSSIAVTGTFWQDTQPVSATDLDIRNLSKTQDNILIYANTAKDGTGTSYVPLLDADGHLQVDVLSGGGAGEQYADGTAVNSAYKGNLILGTDGSNYQILATDSSGNLQVDILNSTLAVTQSGTWILGANSGVDIGDVTINNSSLVVEQTTAANLKATVTQASSARTITSGTIDVLGDTAHDAVDSGDPVKIGGKAATSTPTAVAAGDRVNAYFDTNGRLAIFDGGTTLSIDDGGGSITIDGSVSIGTALPAGTNNIGDVDIASIAAGDNNIGNVDIVTVPAPLNVVGGGTEAAALRVTIANDSTGVVSIDDNGGSITVDGTITANLAAGTNNIGDVDVVTLPAITIAASQTLDTVSTITNVVHIDDNAGSLTVDGSVSLAAAIPAGTNNIGDVDIASALPTGTNTIGNVGVVPRTTGGATPYKLVSAASTNATSLKASAGQVFMITASNVNAAACYLKFYNKASAPTVGTDTPILTFIIPGNTAGAGTNIPVPACGIAFDTGIAFATTVEATDAGTTGVAADEVVINIAYA